MGIFDKSKKVNKINIKVLNNNDTIEIMDNEIKACINSELVAFRIADISKIAILTTDKGPFVDDVALAITLHKDVIVIPSEHDLYQKFLFDYISKKVSIDFQKVIEASSSTQNAEFIIYIKQ